MKLCFIHGWGFHAGIWKPITEHLEDHEHHYVDLGFLKGGPPGDTSVPDNSLCIAHSTGVLWLLKQRVSSMQGLISITGFDCFFAHSNPRTLLAMEHGLNRNPIRQMQAFWHTAGIDPICRDDALIVPELKEGLNWLKTWDARTERHALTCPCRALAARDDKIVTETMTETIWSNHDLHWCERGGHALPLTQPDWCARHIIKFIQDLKTS